MLWIGVHLPALSLESFMATLAPEAPGSAAAAPAPGKAPAPALAQVQAQAQAQAQAPAYEPEPFGPVALIDRHRLVAVNAVARELGLVPGQRRATALAMAPRLRLGEADPERDAAALLAVVHVLMAFTPAVSIAPGHVVLAEVQASLRYFGGLPRLLERLRAGLAPLGHRLRIACAPTPQGAQWMSAWPGLSRATAAPPRDAAQWRARILALPASAMAAAGPHLAAFESLGLHAIADVLRQPRAGLTRRFGGALLADIDRALGDAADPRVSLEPAPCFDSRLELFMRADDSAALLVGAAVLLHRLTAWASARHGLVAGFELRLHHESRRKTAGDPAAQTTTLQIGLGEPVTDTGHLQALLRERLQRLPLAASVIELSLYCDAIAPGEPPNAELFPCAASVGEGWARLLERFEARLGAHNIQRLETVADHRPELATAVRRGGALAPRAGLRAGPRDGTRAGPSSERPLSLPIEAPAEPLPPGAPPLEPAHWPRLRRPVWLLPQAQPLRDESGTPLLGGRALHLVAGPERIEAGWWDDIADATGRDYFIAQADDGALLWVYRCLYAPQEEQSAWYLHGRFG